MTLASCQSVNDKTKKSRRGKTPAARANKGGKNSGFEGVTARAVAFGRGNGQAHFLSQGAGQEATHRVGLPVGGFHEVVKGGSAGPFQQVQDLGGVAALAGAFALFTGLSPVFARACLIARPC